MLRFIFVVRDACLNLPSKFAMEPAPRNHQSPQLTQRRITRCQPWWERNSLGVRVSCRAMVGRVVGRCGGFRSRLATIQIYRIQAIHVVEIKPMEGVKGCSILRTGERNEATKILLTKNRHEGDNFQTVKKQSRPSNSIWGPIHRNKDNKK